MEPMETKNKILFWIVVFVIIAAAYTDYRIHAYEQKIIAPGVNTEIIATSTPAVVTPPAKVYTCDATCTRLENGPKG